ncbi:hypothetical protein I4U23_023748 [Adineta vaga]|nr:hypothetical protein I4U23_023748 [Adineta vaga]
MLFLKSIFFFVIFYIYKISSECESNATLWTYYPCSFIISPSSFYCSHVSIIASIDQCSDREMIFFWHFPFGNMTLTLQSDKNQPFLLRLSRTSLLSNKLIKHVYHLINNRTLEEEMIYNNHANGLITLYSDKYNQCSMKFQSINENIYNYGTFIRMTALVDKTN